MDDLIGAPLPETLPEPTHSAYREPEGRCSTFDGIDFEEGYVFMSDGTALEIVSLKDDLGDETWDVDDGAYLIAQWDDGVQFVINLTTLPEPLSFH